MHETCYVNFLNHAIKVADPRSVTSITSGLLVGVPEQIRSTLPPLAAGCIPRGLPAPDSLLGDPVTCRAHVVVEFKSPTAATNWHRRTHLRAAVEGDTRRFADTDRICQAVYNHYLATDEWADAPHWDRDCGGTDDWCGVAGSEYKVERSTPATAGRLPGDEHKRHYAAVNQGDYYATTLAWLPAELTCQHPRNLTYVLVVPTRCSEADFRTGLRSDAVWHTSFLPDVLDAWEAQPQPHPPIFTALIEVTRHFCMTA